MILHLTLKKKWFDMISSGEKKQEYREIKPYWMSRLFATKNGFDGCRQFSAVEFKNGYATNSPIIRVQCLGIDFGYGKPEWGAVAGTEYFVIKLGKIL